MPETAALQEISPTANKKTISPVSGSSFSSDILPTLSNIQMPPGTWMPEIDQVRRPSELAKEPDGSNSTGDDTEMSMERSSGCLSNDTPLVDRLQHVAEQAKLANFEDLDDVILAYQISRAENGLENSMAAAPPGSLRRVTRLIATMRHAAKEWKDWERSGFPLD